MLIYAVLCFNVTLDMYDTNRERTQIIALLCYAMHVDHDHADRGIMVAENSERYWFRFS